MDILVNPCQIFSQARSWSNLTYIFANKAITNFPLKCFAQIQLYSHSFRLGTGLFSFNQMKRAGVRKICSRVSKRCSRVSKSCRRVSKGCSRVCKTSWCILTGVGGPAIYEVQQHCTLSIIPLPYGNCKSVLANFFLPK